MKNKWSNGSEDPFGPFSMSDFKKWMSQQKDDSRNRMVGLEVESKVPYKKLIGKIEVEEGDLIEVAREFYRNGGTISEENGHHMFVTVESGKFMIHRMYLKRAYD